MKESIWRRATRIILYPVAFIVFVAALLGKGGVKKAHSQGIICDPVHDPMICDPVHEPPFMKAADFMSQKPIVVVSAFTLLLFPIYLYYSLKRIFPTKFTTFQLLKKVVLLSTLWAVGYVILLSILYLLFSTLGLIEYYGYQSDLANIIVFPFMFFPIFFVLTSISGIELLIISINDRRFLPSGIVLFITSFSVIGMMCFAVMALQFSLI